MLEYAPVELKKAITGNGKAGKMLVQQTIMKLMKLQNLPAYNDAADALGLAYLSWKQRAKLGK
ncbi:MAG: crossover junction endodeoxyribonuclease RuvC [bacterium]